MEGSVTLENFYFLKAPSEEAKNNSLFPNYRMNKILMRNIWGMQTWWSGHLGECSKVKQKILTHYPKNFTFLKHINKHT